MNKVIILDRDGTINKDIEYAHRVEDLQILPEVINGLTKFRDAGYKFIIITNQAGIARNFYSEVDMHKFNTGLLEELGSHGINIEAIYFCPHHPEFSEECDCRKPKTWLVEQAAQKFNFNPQESIFIGDKDSDIQLGKNCGGITVLIDNGQYENKIVADFRVKNLNEAFEALCNSKSI